MQTNFSLAQLADPDTRESEKILRSCVHCGFCTATCPTYLLLGDELDSPRGRIYLIKDMLENGKPATQDVVTHIDRCLSCLSCMTTCPSGVHYMHLVDHARVYIEDTFVRGWADRLVRALLAHVLPYRNRFRLALIGASLVRRLGVPALWQSRGVAGADPHTAPRIMTGTGLLRRLSAMLTLAPPRLPSRSHHAKPQIFAAEGARRGRVALLTGCAQAILAPSINEAAIRFLTRRGIEVVLPAGEGCCSALVHHMGRDHEALAFARRAIDVWMREIEVGGLDAIVVTASGCGTTIKDYGFMLREDPAYADKAARVSGLAKDVSEYVETLDLGTEKRGAGLTVAYHSACSMQHGQKLADVPKRLLRAAGFKVKDVPEGHICCGSAGTYNILQPGLAVRLRDRKLANIAKTRPDVVATGNIGCITQLAPGTSIPIVHTIELLDWATGGPTPGALEGRILSKPSPDAAIAGSPARADFVTIKSQA
ncbi:MAG: glycolate oxidase subunit GlcF [Beijerinckiaceae bacterium]